MARQEIQMMNGTLLVVGYDRPFETWFALHHDDGDPNSPPRVAVGYHPAEQAILRDERPDAVIGPYPVDDFPELAKQIAELMGIKSEEKQADCYSCGKPPWESNPDCAIHPYNRLKEEW